ncbi:MAG: AMP-binding protein [Clostridia bacterium]|jgi:acyl carrier protein|nr:AMP-binding protein [Clostridia bacterium]MBT7123334.1 AMP-binding protein [Clostridia bacterium]
MTGFDRKLDELRANLTLGNLFSILCSYGDTVAAEYQTDGKIEKLTYADYKRISVAGAANLSKILKDIERGTFVALRLANDPLWPAVFWSIILAGYRPLLVDATCEDKQIMHILKQAGSAAIVSDTLVSDDGVTCVSPHDYLRIDMPAADFSPVFGDAIGLCTSGTTTSPKVYVYSEKAICEQVLLAEDICKHNKEILHDGEIKQLAFLPFHHIFGLVAVYLWYAFFGKTMVFIKARTGKVIMSACKQHKVTHIYAVPLLWNNVVKGLLRKAKLQGDKTYNKLIKATNISISLRRRLGKLGKIIAAKVLFKDLQNKLVGDSIQFMISGGAHIKPETIRIINAIGYHLVSGFGMTETGINSVELSNNIDKCMQAGVGKPFAPMEYSLRKANESDNTGELLLRGEAIHSGRMIDGAYEPRDLSDGGWFASGDIAREDNGRYFIEGRVKDVIINESGENIYPDELEDSFAEMGGAEQICVVGLIAQNTYDEAALVVYMGENGQDAKNVDALFAKVSSINKTLPLFKKISKAYLSLDPLPMANGIKVRRQKVKQSIEQNKDKFEEMDITSSVFTAYDDDFEATTAPESDNAQMTSIKDEVRRIFAEELRVDPSKIRDTDHFIDDLGGDSLKSLGVFAKAEERYDVIIRDTEYFTCADVEDLAKLLYKKVSEKG